MEIVKIQRREHDIIISIPATMQHIVDGVDHMKCRVVDGGLFYEVVK